MLTAVKALRPAALVWIGCGFCLWAGCAQSTLEDPATVVQVHGTVSYKGQPVADAQIGFHRMVASENEPQGESAFGLTDAHGQYTAMTNDVSGIFPGDYRVTVSHPRLSLPKNYADVDATSLELTVEKDEPDQEFLISLED